MLPLSVWQTLNSTTERFASPNALSSETVTVVTGRPSMTMSAISAPPSFRYRIRRKSSNFSNCTGCAYCRVTSPNSENGGSTTSASPSEEIPHISENSPVSIRSRRLIPPNFQRIVSYSLSPPGTEEFIYTCSLSFLLTSRKPPRAAPPIP